MFSGKIYIFCTEDGKKVQFCEVGVVNFFFFCIKNGCNKLKIREE